MDEARKRGSTARLRLSMTEARASDFTPLLQQGLGLETRVGCSVEEFLTGDMGLEPPYIDGKISTIFLDGKPVDDLRGARIKDGSTLALSGAMPGLLGATMRRDGFYAALRDTISHRREDEATPAMDGTVVLKLFNVIARDLGERLLQRGVWMKSANLADFMTSRTEDFWSRCEGALWNDRPLRREELRRMEYAAESGFVQLQVGWAEGA